MQKRQVNCYEEDHTEFKIIAAARKLSMMDLFHVAVLKLKEPEPVSTPITPITPIGDAQND